MIITLNAEESPVVDIALASPTVVGIITIPGPEGPPGTGVDNLDELGDVVLTSVQAGEVLKYDGTNWVNDATVAGSIIVQEGDVTKVLSAATVDYNNTDFDVIESPTGEANIGLSSDIARVGDVSDEAVARGVADATLQTNINVESSARADADATLDNRLEDIEIDYATQTALTSEINARAAADATLDGRLDTIEVWQVSADPLTQYQKESEKDQPLGYASVDAGGKIPATLIPSIALSETFTVGSQAAMLALTAQIGDIAIRTDISKTFVLGGTGDSTLLSDWIELATPTDSVTSVDYSGSASIGAIVIPRDAATGTASLRTLGTGSQQAAAGNDSRLSDTRTPTDNTVATIKLQNNAVTNAKLATMAEGTIKGRAAGAGAGDPTDLTLVQLMTDLGATAQFDDAVHESTLDQMSPAEGDVNLNGNKLINVLDGSAAQDAATWGQTIVAVGKSGGQTIIGGTGSGDNLTLKSTSHATKGTIFFDTPCVELVTSNYTHTDAANALNLLLIDATITMNAGGSGVSGQDFRGIKYAPTIVFDQASYVFGGSVFLEDQSTLKNASGEANDITVRRFILDGVTIQADGATVAIGEISTVGSNIVFDRINSGTLNAATLNHVRAQTTINTGATLTIRRGLYFQNAIGSGALTNQVAVDIEALTKGTAYNLGLRNAAGTAFTATTKTITAAGNSISVAATDTSTYIRLNNTSGGSITLTSTPTITDGQSGQLLIIENISLNAVVFQRHLTLSGSNLRLGASTRTLNQFDILTLIFDPSNNEWIEIAFTDNS